MLVRTFAVSVPAPASAVFHFLANIENLPRWAPEFCERVALSRRGWFALTALGELFLELEADEHTGVIDLHAGDDRERVVLLPLRVLATPAGDAVVSAVVYETFERPVAQFERLSELLARELEEFARTFGGDERPSALAETGLAVPV